MSVEIGIDLFGPKQFPDKNEINIWEQEFSFVENLKFLPRQACRILFLKLHDVQLVIPFIGGNFTSFLFVEIGVESIDINNICP